MQTYGKTLKKRNKNGFFFLLLQANNKIMANLSLPAYEVRTQKDANGKMQIWDQLRLQFVALTPEEWVRQHFVHFLTDHLGYPPALMANEVGIELNGMSRRCDTVLYSTELRPRMIIEYKRPNVAITQKVFDQISRYNLAMHVDYLIVSNGTRHYCCFMNYEDHTYRFLDHIPSYAEL